MNLKKTLQSIMKLVTPKKIEETRKKLEESEKQSDNIFYG